MVTPRVGSDFPGALFQLCSSNTQRARLGFVAHSPSFYPQDLNFFTATSSLQYFPTVIETGRNCMDLYPTFLAVMWCAGLCLSQAPAAFAGIIYLVVRQKYFVGYLGQTSQSTPGYLFGKRILSFLFLMCIVGILNYLLTRYFGSNYKEYVDLFTNAASALLLIP
ncbi:arachidonate 5-lipoxygenase-activating protein [Scomber scombrus]|uniref:Arachidonate 5-lipoxygenase-activating protein n=1 Tax=Scomber scombrus TaxID=13677 RepID=A0AAV1PBE6_SCOSC